MTTDGVVTKFNLVLQQHLNDSYNLGLQHVGEPRKTPQNVCSRPNEKFPDVFCRPWTKFPWILPYRWAGAKNPQILTSRCWKYSKIHPKIQMVSKPALQCIINTQQSYYFTTFTVSSSQMSKDIFFCHSKLYLVRCIELSWMHVKHLWALRHENM